MGKPPTPEELDPVYLKGFKDGLDYIVLQLLAKQQRVSDRLYRLTGTGEPWKE